MTKWLNKCVASPAELVSSEQRDSADNKGADSADGDSSGTDGLSQICCWECFVDNDVIDLTTDDEVDKTGSLYLPSSVSSSDGR